MSSALGIVVVVRFEADKPRQIEDDDECDNH